MSLYTQFNHDGDCTQVASNTGWSEFIDWVESLDGYARLKKLCDDGECEDITGLRTEVEDALEKSKPDADTEDVAHQLIHNIDAAGKAEIVLITNGVTA